MGAVLRWLKTGETPGDPRVRGQGRADAPTDPPGEQGVPCRASGKRQWHAAAASGGGGLVSDSERTARRALVAVGRRGLGRASKKSLRLRRGSRHGVGIPMSASHAVEISP